MAAALTDCSSPGFKLLPTSKWPCLHWQESPQMAPGHHLGLPHVSRTTARPQLQPQLQSQPQAGANTAMQRHPSRPLPSAHFQQHRPPQLAPPASPTPYPHPSRGPTCPQHHPSLSQAQARQQSPSCVSAAPANLTFQQQQKLLLQQQQFHQAQLRQQQQRPVSAPAQAVVSSGQQQQQPQVYSQPPASLQHPQHPQQQPAQPQLPQQQQQWQVTQTAAAPGQVRQQAETARQPSRPSSASPPPGVQRIPQAQQQLLNLQQPLHLQRQLPQSRQQEHGSATVSPHANRIKSGQAHTLQQIQAVQSQLKGQVQGHSQGQGAAALPQRSFSQGQGQGHLVNGVPQVNFNPGQGKFSAALPQSRAGQLPSISPVRAEVSNGPWAMPVPAMRSPTASSSGSAAASPVKSGEQPSTLMTHMQASCHG